MPNERLRFHQVGALDDPWQLIRPPRRRSRIWSFLRRWARRILQLDEVRLLVGALAVALMASSAFLWAAFDWAWPPGPTELSDRAAIAGLLVAALGTTGVVLAVAALIVEMRAASPREELSLYVRQFSFEPELERSGRWKVFLLNTGANTRAVRAVLTVQVRFRDSNEPRLAAAHLRGEHGWNNINGLVEWRSASGLFRHEYAWSPNFAEVGSSPIETVTFKAMWWTGREGPMESKMTIDPRLVDGHWMEPFPKGRLRQEPTHELIATSPQADGVDSQ